MPGLQARVIVNPEAGSRSVSREWPQIEMLLREAGLSFDFEFTGEAGHATEIAGRAVERGCRYLIAVGGDGTVNEVATGILHSKHPHSTILGIVSTGTAHALAFSLGLADDIDNLNPYSFLVDPRSVLIDVGVVRCRKHGKPVERFFLNEASTGITAEIVEAWKTIPNRFGKSVNLALRTAAAYRALTVYRNKKARLQVGREVEVVSLCALVVANGPYFADRMLIAPRASLVDGLLNAVVARDMSRLDLMKIRPVLYVGSHLQHPAISQKATLALDIESEEDLLVEADGEVLGECPASFRILPSALKVAVQASHLSERVFNALNRSGNTYSSGFPGSQ